MLLVFWFVIRIGLRADTARGEPDFFPWLAVGMVSWFYAQDMINRGTDSFRAYKHIVTKMKFPTSVIPTFVGISNLFVHVVLVSIVMVYLALMRPDHISIHWVQIPLYVCLMFLFFVAWSLLTAPLSALSKDFSQLVKSIGRILFWISGILWSVRSMDIEWIKTVMLFNPINFFVEGYRSALLYGEWFWEDLHRLMIFGVTFIVMVVLAIVVFRRTKTELADVL